MDDPAADKSLPLHNTFPSVGFASPEISNSIVVLQRWGIALCVAGLLRIRRIVIGIGILRAGRVAGIICRTLHIATELRPLAGLLRLLLE